MAKIHNLGFPRIGLNQELEHILEAYWQEKIEGNELESEAEAIWLTNLDHQGI